MRNINSMYDSDLSIEQWLVIEHCFQPADNRGAVPAHAKCIIVNAILYLVKTGAQWRMLPKDFPPWKTVYDHYRRWSRLGIWERIIDELSELYRKKNGKDATPGYGIIDSQSVKTISCSEERGFGGGKNIKGKKRHIVVDTLVPDP